MARQSATQHLDLLEAANLSAPCAAGGEKLHYLNPVPLHEIQERWIDKFERPRLRTLSDRETTSGGRHDRQAAHSSTSPTSRARRSRVWEALTDADLTAQYWGHSNVSDWQAGSTLGAPAHRRVRHRRRGRRRRRERTADAGWSPPGRRRGDGRRPSRVTFDIEPHGEIVRLTVTHEDLADEADEPRRPRGWAAVLSNLKSLIETGSPLPRSRGCPLEPGAVLCSGATSRADRSARGLSCYVCRAASTSARALQVLDYVVAAASSRGSR